MSNTILKTQQQRTALIMVLINAFTTPLMLSAVNVALPQIANDLALGAITISWIPMAYLMASAMFLFLFGRMADVYGRKRIFLAGTLCVVITSVLAAFSMNSIHILSARFFQGMSAAMLYATQVAIVTSIFPPQKRGQMVGLTISMIYLGLSFGPVIGGICIDTFGWRSAFLIHVPLAILVLIIGFFRVSGDWKAEGEARIDLVGASIFAIAIACLCFGVTQLPTLNAYLFVVFSLVLFIWFVKLQYSQQSPLLNVRLFLKNKIFRYSCTASLIMYSATFANVVLISLYLQYLKDMSATSAGLIMMIQPLTMAVFSPLAGRLSDRLEPRVISSLGMSLTILGLLLLSMLTAETSTGWIIFSLVLIGMGFGLFSSPNVNAIMGSIEKRYYGSANAVVAMMRIVGQLCSMILVAMIFSLMLGTVEIKVEYFSELEQSIQRCFLVACIICVPGLFFSYYRGELHSEN